MGFKYKITILNLYFKHEGVDFFSNVQIAEHFPILRGFNQEIQKRQTWFFCT